jgi:hypothetical protein
MEQDLTNRMDKLEKEVHRINRLFEKACQYQHANPSAALWQARVSAESICKRIYVDLGLEKSGKPAAKQELDSLIQALAHKVFPDRICILLRTIQSFGNFGSHDQGDESDQITGEYVEPCLTALSSVVKWYFSEYLQVKESTIREFGNVPATAKDSFLNLVPLPSITQNKPKTQSGNLNTSELPDYRVVTMQHLHSIGMSTDFVVKELLKMDYDTLSGLNDQHSGYLEQWIPVVDNNPDGIRIVLTPEDKIVGYWHFVALDLEMFLRAKTGIMFDSEITCQSMRILGFPGDYLLYFVCIAVSMEFRGIKIMRLMFDSFCESLRFLADNGMFVDELCATAFTEAGIAMCKSAKMEYLRRHVDHGEIYCKSLRSLPSPFDVDARLKEMYSMHFGK